MMYPHYLVKLKATKNIQSLPALHSVKQIAGNCRRKVFCFLFLSFSSLLRNSFNNLQFMAEMFLSLHRFLTKIYLQKLAYSFDM